MQCYPTKPPKALIRIWTNIFNLKKCTRNPAPPPEASCCVIFGYFLVINRQAMGYIYIYILCILCCLCHEVQKEFCCPLPWTSSASCVCFVVSRCPESLRPETVRPCLLPCKRDCIVTPYSDWSPCPSTCQRGMSLLMCHTCIIKTIHSMDCICSPNPALLHCKMFYFLLGCSQKKTVVLLGWGMRGGFLWTNW